MPLRTRSVKCGNVVHEAHYKHALNGRPRGWSLSCEIKNSSVLKCFGTYFLATGEQAA